MKVAERFWRYVDKTDSCWNWTGAKTGGYGIIRTKHNGVWVNSYAHRVSYEIHFGSIPNGTLVRHSCDVKNCVNPSHLELGTQKDNMQDAVRRHQLNQGEKNGGGRMLSERDVLWIKSHLDSISQTAIAKKFGITQSMVSRIKRGIAWRHV